MAMLALESFMRIACPAGGAISPPSVGKWPPTGLHVCASDLSSITTLFKMYIIFYYIIFCEWPTVDVFFLKKNTYTYLVFME